MWTHININIHTIKINPSIIQWLVVLRLYEIRPLWEKNFKILNVKNKQCEQMYRYAELWNVANCLSMKV